MQIKVRPDPYEIHKKLKTLLGDKFIGVLGDDAGVTDIVIKDGEILTPTEETESKKIANSTAELEAKIDALTAEIAALKIA